MTSHSPFTLSPLTSDYRERVYAAVLGKLIGVYCGRPFECWPHEQILKELGEIRSYVHERRGLPLVVTDDDISGTWLFLRALEDLGPLPADLTGPALVERVSGLVAARWLNDVVPGRSTFWWGGVGVSTEHTAYENLRAGLRPPESGSIARNGAVTAEQIGAQIFIDGWGLVAPGDPGLAASLARAAACVSHDGAAVHASMVLAAMLAAAFQERDVNRLLEIGLAEIPADSAIRRLADDVRNWHAQHSDWYAARAALEAAYGPERYPGVHILPNHGVVLLSLLYADGDFDRGLTVACTAGWDTDCNAGNVACLLGLRGGLEGIANTWREPVADRAYISSADGRRSITDAVRLSTEIVDHAQRLRGLPPSRVKGGAPFHFEMPGSRQGFTAEPATARLSNLAGAGRNGARALAIDLPAGVPVAVTTPVFAPPDALNIGYQLQSCPALYAGQMLRIDVLAPDGNATHVLASPLIRVYDAQGELQELSGPEMVVLPGAGSRLSWALPELDGQPVEAVGLRAKSAVDARLLVDRVWWEGAPRASLIRGTAGGALWLRAWIDGVDALEATPEAPLVLRQTSGRGVALQGGPGWDDLIVSADLALQGRCGGLVVRATGLRRYVAFELEGDTVRLVHVHDGARHVLDEAEGAQPPGERFRMSVRVAGTAISAALNDRLWFDHPDLLAGLPAEGMVGLFIAEGRLEAHALRVDPAV
ncbi:MAG: ADP-ribosylglycohydrolase family protein [Anaerolineales bacterium]|nr:ADP-ribosylglycohydrolase family protein [Anaerolineales bacterium]